MFSLDEFKEIRGWFTHDFCFGFGASFWEGKGREWG